MTTQYYQISRTAARALEEFSNEFREALALGDFETWAQQLGFVRTTDALKTTFPIPLDAAGYHEFKGDFKYRSLYSRSLSMKSRKWQDGVEEDIDVIRAPDFVDWTGAPARMATEWQRLPNQVVADMLALNSLEGPVLDFYRDPDTNTAGTRRLFATDHPCNVLDSSKGTFDNTMSASLQDIQSGKFFDDLNLRFRQVNGPNGKPMGLRAAGGNLLVPATLENLFKNTLSFDTIVRSVDNVGKVGATSNVVAGVPQNNIYKGTIGYTVADELADQTYFYAIAGGKPGLFPWVVQIGGAPEEFLHDENSEKYKSSLKVGVAYVGKLEAAACLPHRIIRVHYTG